MYLTDDSSHCSQRLRLKNENVQSENASLCRECCSRCPERSERRISACSNLSDYRSLRQHCCNSSDYQKPKYGLISEALLGFDVVSVFHWHPEEHDWRSVRLLLLGELLCCCVEGSKGNP